MLPHKVQDVEQSAVLKAHGEKDKSARFAHGDDDAVKSRSRPTLSSIVKLAKLLALIFITVKVGSSLLEAENLRSPLNRPTQRNLCPQVPPYKLKEPLTNLTSPARQELAHLLSGAIKIDTTVPDDWPTVEQDPERWANVFNPFQAYLEQSFPAVHADDSPVKRTLVNQHGLLFEWPGSETDLKPLLLMAHQDVVPVEPTTVDQWRYPPFSGYYDENTGAIWGRGAADTKSSIISTLASIESLVANGYVPKRSVIVSFGFDEESSGTQGALELASHLESKYGAKSMAMIVDEGTGIEKPDLGNLVPAIASPAVREKGYVDVSVKVQTKGGHSSVPTPHTSIGHLSKIIVALEAKPHQPILRTDNPAFTELLCSTQNKGANPKLVKAIHEILELEEKKASMASAKACPRRQANLEKRLEKAKQRALLAMSPLQKVPFQTTQAVDLIKGGIKVNALPEEAEAIVNHRLEPGTSVEALQEQFTALIKPIADSLELNLKAFGKDIDLASGKAKGTIVLSRAFGSGLEPSPATPFQGEDAKPWQLISSIIRSTWSSGLEQADRQVTATRDPSILVVPGLMIGNTDTSRYWNLTDHIFRFSPDSIRVPPEGMPEDGGVHTVNEYAFDDALVQGWSFYTSLITAVSQEEL